MHDNHFDGFAIDPIEVANEATTEAKLAKARERMEDAGYRNSSEEE